MKTLKLSALLLTTMLIVSACSKENTYTNRISRSWKILKFTQNGVDKTSDWNAIWVNYRISFTKDKRFSETATIATIPVGRVGDWEFTDNYKGLFRKYDDNGETQAFELITLTSSKLTVRQSGNNVDEWELIPQ